MDAQPVLAHDRREVLPHAVLQQRDRIFRTPGFQSGGRLRKLLEFLLDKALAETEPNLKEYVIAVEVFDKSASFDPKIDPIVRVHASRLRSKLKAYFETAGEHDPLLISLPERGYCPIIQVRPTDGTPRAIRVVRNEFRTLSTLYVVPFVALGTGLELRFFSQGLTDELVELMTHYSGLRIIASSGLSDSVQRAPGAAILEGRVRKSGQQFRISAQLINASDRAYMWAGGFTRKSGNIISVQQDVSRAILEALKTKIDVGVPK